MKTQNYSEQIKSPKWQKKRLDILNLRGFKCEECGNEEQQLHIHHRFYIKGRKAWEYDNDVFQVLCENCHKSKHETKPTREIPKLYQEILTLLDEWQGVNCGVSEDIRYLLQLFLVGKPDRTHMLFEYLCTIAQSKYFDSLIDYINDYKERIEFEFNIDVRLFEIEQKLKLK